MFLKTFVINGILLVYFVQQSIGNRKCYEAKICIHNNKEKCGQDKNGKVRRFYDTCDILEYNCLKGTDYVKTDLSKCESLPPIEEQTESKQVEGDLAEKDDVQETMAPEKVDDNDANNEANAEPEDGNANNDDNDANAVPDNVDENNDNNDANNVPDNGDNNDDANEANAVPEKGDDNDEVPGDTVGQDGGVANEAT